MEVSEVINKLEELRGASTLSASDKSEIILLYGSVLGKTFVKTSCSDCYRDAIIEMYLYLKRNGKMKEKSNYTLKAGALIQDSFGGNMYTNDNLTDEIAEKFLATNPKGITFFASQPTDWEDRVAKRAASKNKTVSLNDALVASLVEELEKEGATADTVKEVYKSYELDGKKLTAKILDNYIKAAQETIATKGE